MTDNKIGLNDQHMNNLTEEAKSYYELKKTFKLNKLLNQEHELYILEKEFLNKWKLYVNYNEFKEKEERNYYKNLRENVNRYETQPHPGRIDNSKLLMDVSNYYNISDINCHDFILNSDLKDGFVIINKNIWEFFSKIYGGGPLIVKKSVKLKTDFHFRNDISLFHIKVNLIVLPKEITKVNIQNLFHKALLISKYDNVENLKEKISSIVLQSKFNKEEMRIFSYKSTFDGLKKSLMENLQIYEQSKIIPAKPDFFTYLEKNLKMITKDISEEFVIIDCFNILDYPAQEIIENICCWCEEKLKLNYPCLCKDVWYCSHSCLENDKRFHLERCKHYSGKSSIYMSSLSKNGIVGLQNLGNTCYMNSALQCISNCYELTKYFLDNHYKNHINTTNNIGAHGLMANCYADLVTNLWYGKDSVYTPSSFKRVLDKLNSYFSGNQQHDSQEFLIYLLDLLHEDLNRVLNKPYVNVNIPENEDSVKSAESWEYFLRRNQSIIVDVFFGQFKSTLLCLKCENKSVTFDTFSFVPLPLSSKTYTFEIFSYFIFFDCTIKPIRINLIFNSDCSIMVLRNKVAELLDIHPFSFIIFKLNQKGDIKVILNSTTFIKGTIEEGNHPFYLVQIDPKYFYSASNNTFNLNTLPDFKNIYNNLKANQSKIEKKYYESIDENEFGQTSEEKTYYSKKYDINRRKYFENKFNVDNNYGFTKEFINTLLYMKNYSGDMKYIIDREKIIFPRIILIDKKWTLKQLHTHIFKFIKPVLLDYEKENNPNQFFNDLTSSNNHDDKLFDYFFPNLNTNYKNDTIEYQILQNYPYRIRIHSIDDGEKCYFCGGKFCEDCLLPFDENITVNTLLSYIPNVDQITVDNTYLFINEGQRNNYKNMDFILEMSFLPKYIEAVKTLIEYKEVTFNYLKQEKSPDETLSLIKNLTIYDCFSNFQKYEVLKDIDEWQCQICKKNQASKKKIEIYLAPHILIIQLKRFTTNSKLDTFVEFPIEGLNLEPYIIKKENMEEKNTYIYDLFAVSNHLGGIGGGHYISFAKNYYDKCWYKYDDSNVTKMNDQDIVTKEAYVLFYRKRNSKLNYEELYKKPFVTYETSEFASNSTMTNRSYYDSNI